MGDPGSWSHDDVDGWVSDADNVNGWGSLAGGRRMAQDLIMLLRMVGNLKLMNFLFLEFFI